MRGFFALAKQFVSYSTVQTQQIKIAIRLVNQSVNSQFRLCSTLAALRLNNVYGLHQSSSLADSEGELVLEAAISQLLSLSLKAELNTIRNG
ncbi:unnamed protein product (macronuclear) [Paramecium tetraurelia]|uniref:Uncharacterized protein n=1 Tax=Paramecium tetraurelia TaxID=5888 RepID=A0BAY0_PARTE|nr:uncharacterized protein GSPATT00000132001 [Paramecium tetraurelia]CAK55697.1 unnamed protein product [Paramecium tetraurelia]|eukprot:XP_001423095.1 hypothetical protein (macronuclear) [Paramecium tetraurelia strain d4-2]